MKACGADLNGQPPIIRTSLASRGDLLHGALPFELPQAFDPNDTKLLIVDTALSPTGQEGT